MKESDLLRPMLGLGVPCFHIREATEIDSLQEVDKSGLTQLTAESEHGPGADTEERAIVLKFPAPINPGILWLMAWFFHSSEWELWNPNPGPAPFAPFSGSVEFDARVRIFPILDFGGQTVSTLRWSNRNDLTLGTEILAPLQLQEDAYSFANVFELTDFGFSFFNQHHSQRVDLTDESDPIHGLMLRVKVETVTAGLDYWLIRNYLNMLRDAPANDSNWKVWGILPNVGE